MQFTKIKILQSFIEKLEDDLNLLKLSALAAHEAATHEESKQEDKHDTRATEASYLAKGQANRISEINETLNELRGYLTQTKTNQQKAVLGTLITLKDDKKITHSLLTKRGGGTIIKLKAPESKTSGSIDECSFSLLSIHSPLGELVLNSDLHETHELESKSGITEYKVIEIIN